MARQRVPGLGCWLLWRGQARMELLPDELQRFTHDHLEAALSRRDSDGSLEERLTAEAGLLLIQSWSILMDDLEQFEDAEALGVEEYGWRPLAAAAARRPHRGSADQLDVLLEVVLRRLLKQVTRQMVFPDETASSLMLALLQLPRRTQAIASLSSKLQEQLMLIPALAGNVTSLIRQQDSCSAITRLVRLSAMRSSRHLGAALDRISELGMTGAEEDAAAAWADLRPRCITVLPDMDAQAIAAIICAGAQFGLSAAEFMATQAALTEKIDGLGRSWMAKVHPALKALAGSSAELASAADIELIKRIDRWLRLRPGN